MQEKLVFEYAVLRIVPRVEREEFINVGIVLYCPKKKFLRSQYQLDEKRITAFAPKLDIEEIRGYLQAFTAICDGSPQGGPIARLTQPERFRWLTAMRSTILQTSRVHPGLLTDPDEKLQRLFEEIVEVRE